jgi:hypothetical protein
MKFKEIMQLLLLFAAISTFFGVFSTFLGPAKILFRCVINTDNRVFRVILRPGTLDIKMNKRLGIFRKLLFKKDTTPLDKL